MNGTNMESRLAEALSGADECGLPAELLRDWEPVECLGHSRMCETLLVLGRHGQGRAVVKRISAGQADAELTGMLAALSHPGLPKILQVWHDETGCSILREYVDGCPADDPSRVWTEREVIGLGVKLCDTLQYLHTRTPPVIHRDVKPENIILRADGSPVLIDFGIARLFRGSAESDTRVMGTEHYAPPEQYGFRQTDARSDLYSLGMTLCRLLTGQTGGEAAAGIRNAALRRVLTRCTAFSPEDRFSSAAQLKKALLRCLSPKRAWWITAACLLAAIAAGLLIRQTQPAPVRFAEPLIEQAVRLTLGAAEDARLTEEQLASVTGLYIAGDIVCTDQNGFYASVGLWDSDRSRPHGSIATLEDVKLLPGLTEIMLAAQQISDLSPLASLTKLTKIEFKHNAIADLTPLKGVTTLVSVGLNDNAVTDLTPLTALPSLAFLDLCDANGYEAAAIGALGDLEYLDISNRTDSWRHLGTRRVRQLKLGWTGLDSLDALSGISGLEFLSIEHTKITTLEGIEAHTGLTGLRISGCALRDLSPLLALPSLRQVTASRDQQPLIEALGDVAFTVVYE